MKFLADENFPLPSVRKLRESGHDVVAVIVDSAGAADEEILARAASEQRIVLTFDRDFGELVFRKRLPAPEGIVLFRFDPANPEEPGNYLLELVKQQGLTLAMKFTVASRRQIRQRPFTSDR